MAKSEEDEEEYHFIHKLIGGAIAAFFFWFIYYKFFTPAKDSTDKAIEKMVEEKIKEINPLPKIEPFLLESMLLDTVWETDKVINFLDAWKFDNINFSVKNGNTFFIALARSEQRYDGDSTRYVHALEKLRSYKPNLNFTDQYGRTALAWNTIFVCLNEGYEYRYTARWKKFKIKRLQAKDTRPIFFHEIYQRFLLDNYAAVDLPDNRGNTPLMFACMCKSKKHIALLLERGANPHMQNKKGQTAYHFAGNHSEILALLNSYSKPNY